MRFLTTATSATHDEKEGPEARVISRSCLRENVATAHMPRSILSFISKVGVLLSHLNTS